MMQCDIDLIDGEDADATNAILQALKSYNIDRFGLTEWKDIVIALRDESGKVIGGLAGQTARGWLYTRLLFIPQQLRGQGLGRKLLGMAEDEACKRGCKGAYIDTLNPDALATYRACGYEVFGEIKDFGPDYSLTYLKKSLV